MLLVGLAIFGSAFLAAMAFLLGFNKTLKLGGFADVKAQLGDISIKTWAIADDGSTALVCDDGAALYLIKIMGDRAVTREISPADVTIVSEHHIRIHSADLGFPALDFVCAHTNLANVLNSLLDPSPA
jgi:hypothetical protein